MIVAEQKPINKILDMLPENKRVLVVGCDTCVTVCLAGGEKEVKVLSAALRMAKKIGVQPFTAASVLDGNRQRVVIEPFEWGSGTATTHVVHDLRLYLARLEQRLVECPALWRDLRRSDLLPRMGIFERTEL